MDRRSPFLLSMFAALGLTLGTLAFDAYAQCDSCGPTVTSALPVVQTAYYQPTVAYQPYTGWYPGKLLDLWRMNRWNPSTTVATPAYTSGYAPTYAAAPLDYTASYAPAVVAPSASYVASYTPYLTPYAPLQRTSTVYRPVLLRPVVAMQPIAPAMGCDLCTTGCSACSTCESGGVGQAAYYEQPGTGCTSCQDGFQGAPMQSMPYGYPESGGNGIITGPATPQPELRNYGSGKSSNNGGGGGGTGEGGGARQENDPGPTADDLDTKHSGATDFYNKPLEAPPLFAPSNDRSASKPTVDVWNAVYHKRTDASSPVSHSTFRPQREARPMTQAERDAQGWTAVPRQRSASR